MVNKVKFNTKVILCSGGYCVVRKYSDYLKKNEFGYSNTREDKAFRASAFADVRGAYSPLSDSELDSFINENYKSVVPENEFFADEYLEKVTPLKISDVAKNKALNAIFDGISSGGSLLPGGETLSLKVSKPKKKNAVKRRDSLIRTRNEIFLLCMENASEFTSFITLTFAGNPSPEYCYEKFRNYITYIKRLFPGFKYIAVPELQKRGVLHFHLLTNLELDKDIIKQPSKWIKKGFNDYKVIDYYNVLGWSVESGRGYSLAESVDNKDDAFKTALYLVKYITKDLKDVEALRGHRLIMKSQNLNSYQVLYFLEEKNEITKNFETQSLQNKEKGLY